MLLMPSHTVPPALADVVVKDEDGADVRLGDLWATRPLVLAFVRHFGCVFCREHVKELGSCPRSTPSAP